jgi:hypothetical protein
MRRTYFQWPVNLASAVALVVKALTRFSWLQSRHAAQHLGNSATTALACSMQQLQQLCLGERGLQLGIVDGMACLQA